MNELEEYTASLPSPLNREARIKLIEQWKIDNNWGEEKPQPAEAETVSKPEEDKIEPVKTKGNAAGADVVPVQTVAPINTDFGGRIGSLDSKKNIKKALNFNVETFVYGEDLNKNITKKEIKQAENFTKTKYNESEFNKIAGNKVWGVDKYNVGGLTESLSDYSDIDPNATSAYSARTVDEFKKDFELGYDESVYNKIKDNNFIVDPGFDQNLAIDFTGENKTGGVNFLNIDNLQNYRVNFLADSAKQNFSSGSIEEDINIVNNLGDVFLTDKELEFKKLNTAYDNAAKGSKEKRDLYTKLTEIASDENYGERLFWGDNIKNLDIKTLDSDDLQMFQKSQELADTTEVETLKESLVTDYYKIVGLAEEIYKWDSEIKVGLDENGLRGIDIARSKKWNGLNETAVSVGATTISDEDIKRMQTIATTGEIPKDMETLTGSNPLIIAFNKSLNDFKVINRAIQLNRDPLTTDSNYGGDDLVAGFKDLFSVSRDETDQEIKRRYVERVESYGFGIKDKIKDNALETNLGQDFGATFPHLVEWSFDTALFGKITGGGAAKAGKNIIKLIDKSKKLAKIPYAPKIFKAATKASVQATNFAGGTLINQVRTGKEVNLEEIQGSYNFGLALGFGHPLYDGLLKAINKVGPIRNFFAKATNDFTDLSKYKTFNRVQTEVGSGFAGATTYQFGGVLTGGLFDDEGNLTISLRTQALETGKMIALGYLLKGIPGMIRVKEDFASDVTRALNNGKLIGESKKSANNLGLNLKDVTDPNENSLNNLEKALKEKIEEVSNEQESGKLTEEQAANKIESLKNDYKIVDTQLAVNSANEMMKAEAESGNAPKKSEFYIVSQKLKNGEKLNERDSEVLDYYGLDGVNMLFENLGITKDQQSTDMLTAIILNESVISSQLNGKSMLITPYGITPLNPTEFVAPKGTKARENAREFLKTKQKINSEIAELESLNSSKLSESEKIRNKELIKEKQQELLKYGKNGELYKKLQIELDEAAAKAYEEDLAQADPSKGKVIEELTPDDFQKRYDTSGFTKKDVKRIIAFTDKEGNKVINREFALEQRDFTPLTHEIPHSILKDSFKDAEGNVTSEGIEMIDGVLSKLTPVQTKILNQELASRYDINPENKKLWYEENITVLAELIKRGEITFTKSLGEGLAGLVPAFKKLLPNIEVNAETGKGIFDLLKAQDLSKVKITSSSETYDIDGKKVTKEEFDKYSEEQEAKFSEAKKSETVLQAIDKLIPKDVKTKEEYDKFIRDPRKNAKVFESLMNEGGAINNYIRSKSTSREEAEKTIENLQDRMLNFNPEALRADGKKVGVEGFGESIFANTRFAKLFAKSELFKEGEKKKQEKKQDDSTLQLVDKSSGSKPKAIDDKLSKPPSETIKYKSEALKNLDITKKEGETDKDAIENKLSKVIANAYKGQDITRFKQTANIPESIAKFYADMFGITSKGSIEALSKKSRGFNEEDNTGVIRARQFLIDNAASDFARIPRTKDDFVKAGRTGATGVYGTKLGKALYNKNGKLTGSLKNYIDIISGKNVTVNGIEFNALVKGKKLPVYRDSQHIKFALDIHIRNRILETLEPTQGKRIQMGAKFSLGKDPKKGIKEQIHQIKDKIKVLTDKDISQANAEKQVFKDLVFQTKGLLTRKDGISAGFGNSMLTYIVTPFNLSSGGNSSRRNYVAITDASKTRSKDKAKTQKALKNNELFDLSKLKNQIKNSGVPELGPKFTVPQLKQMSLALGASSRSSIAKNKDNAIDIKDGKNNIYDGLYNTYDANPKANLPGLKQIIYPVDQSSNATLGRKIATAVNDANKGDKVPYLEHWKPYGEWALTTVATFGMPKASREAWKKYANEHYYQENISLKTQIAVDKTYIVKLEDGTEVSWKSKDQDHPLLGAQITKFRETGNVKYLKAAGKLEDIRKYPGVHTEVNPFTHGKYGVMDAAKWGLKVSPKLEANLEVQHKASSLINKMITGKITRSEAQKELTAFKTLAPGMSKASKLDNSLLPDAIKYDEDITVEKVVKALIKTDKASANGRKLNAPRKEIYTMDLDDTLIKSKSKVGVEMPDGTTFKINATEFAKRAGELEKEKAEFDFTEFEKIIDGKKGPLFKVLENINAKKGLNDFFILTARPATAAPAIKKFFDALGYKIPIENITGLGNGKPQAKAGWIMGKAAEGYNDFYFADDALNNVKAVKEVLSQLDVKSKVQQAKFSKAKTFNTIVNDMIEDSAGIKSYKEFSAARAKTVGASKGKYNFFIPAGAEDFTGLLYKMLGKGKKGDAQMAFLKDNLLDPYNRAESSVTQAKIAAANDFKALKSNLKTLPNSLSKPTGIGGFTFSHAVRVAAWSAQGMEIPGLSKRDVKELNDFVNKNAELKVFTDELLKIQKGKPYPKPGKSWLGGNITSDIINDINKVNREEYQQDFRENVDIIFSEANMNKMEAAYGTRWREAIEDSLRRMKSGSNRPPGGNRATDGILDWLNNSVGAVMFLNTRSALLQTISAVNFVNWGDNNIAKAGLAFANQKQYWKDYMKLMNSDYLVERRNGLKINVSESEIADAVKDSNNKPKAAIAFLLSKGFVMTRLADSFAIAAGGASFYRNRVKSLLGKGMEQEAAEAQAFEDFRTIAEESQQSSNPNRISSQQASAAGRVILAWANTPMQYARIQKRAGQDLINGRGDWKTNISKIAYYGVVQNLIFNSLQQAVFALGFGEDEDEEVQANKKSDKIARVANGMIDSQLKGLGIGGAAVVALKSSLMELGKQHAKDRPKYEESVDDLLNFSPPLGSKISKIKGGLRSFSWNMKDMQEKGYSLDNPAYLAGAQITTGLTNIPLDRVVKKINNVRGIVNEQSALWQKVALGLGWSTWDVGLGYYGGFDAAKVLTADEEKTKEIDDMKKLTKTKEQVDMLLDLGLSKKEIKALGGEQTRVEKIIELQNAESKPKVEAKVKEEIKEETKPVLKPKVKPKVTAESRLRKQFDSIKDENKPEQVKSLLGFGLTKKEVRALKYEKDRVEKILELMKKNKNK